MSLRSRIQQRRAAGTVAELIVAMEQSLGPLVYHVSHASGRVNCRACRIGHAYAPHYASCDCGHCPDPAGAEAAVLADLARQDAGGWPPGGWLI